MDPAEKLSFLLLPWEKGAPRLCLIFYIIYIYIHMHVIHTRLSNYPMFLFLPFCSPKICPKRLANQHNVRTWRIIPFGKWSITLVNQSSKERVIPFPTGLFWRFFHGNDPSHSAKSWDDHPSNPTNSYTPINLT